MYKEKRLGCKKNLAVFLFIFVCHVFNFIWRGKGGGFVRLRKDGEVVLRETTGFPCRTVVSLCRSGRNKLRSPA